MSLPTRILVQLALTTLVVWWMNTTLSAYVAITGGWPAYVIIAAILTLLNLFVRPILDLLVLPVKFIAGLIGLILVNGVFLWLLFQIIDRIDARFLTFEIRGGIVGWVVVALVLGIAKMAIRLITPAKRD